MYINPPHRFTVYAMGIGLGYILRTMKDLKLTESQLKLGWCFSTASLLFAFFGPAPMGDIDYKFNATHAAQYAAFAPIAWCFFFGWIILVSQLGYKSLMPAFISWTIHYQSLSFFRQIYKNSRVARLPHLHQNIVRPLPHPIPSVLLQRRASENATSI